MYTNHIKKTIALLSLLLCLSTPRVLYAQDAPPPSYLTQQDFPDSVARLTLQSSAGDQVTLAEVVKAHRGNKVVLDFWASWCKDCLVGFPTLDQLMTQTQSQGVDYVLISLDKKERKWKAAIKRFNIRGEHYRIAEGWKNALSNYVELDWIPRYLVLDERGRMMLPKAITADDEALRKSLLE